MKLDHFNIRGKRSELDALKDFYCNVLGLEVGKRPKVKIFGYWLYSEGKAIVHLEETDDQLKTYSDNYFDHIAFSRNDLNPIIENLNQLNINFKLNEIDIIDLTQIIIFDPVGNKLELNFYNQSLVLPEKI